MIYDKQTQTHKKENWKEWFHISFSGAYMRISDGHAVPRWYLPVYKHDYKDAIEVWIFPLAPFVLIGRVIVNMFYSVWRDLLSTLYLLHIWNDKKNTSTYNQDKNALEGYVHIGVGEQLKDKKVFLALLDQNLKNLKQLLIEDWEKVTNSKKGGRDE